MVWMMVKGQLEIVLLGDVARLEGYFWHRLVTLFHVLILWLNVIGKEEQE